LSSYANEGGVSSHSANRRCPACVPAPSGVDDATAATASSATHAHTQRRDDELGRTARMGRERKTIVAVPTSPARRPRRGPNFGPASSRVPYVHGCVGDLRAGPEGQGADLAGLPRRRAQVRHRQVRVVLCAASLPRAAAARCSRRGGGIGAAHVRVSGCCGVRRWRPRPLHRVVPESTAMLVFVAWEACACVRGGAVGPTSLANCTGHVCAERVDLHACRRCAPAP
jgi:hypothetical protein